MKYIVEGEFKMGDKFQYFRKEISAYNEKHALEKIYSLLGSNHKVKRNLIKVKKIEKSEA